MLGIHFQRFKYGAANSIGQQHDFKRFWLGKVDAGEDNFSSEVC